MNVIGLLVKGPEGAGYPVTTDPDRAAGAVLIFRRDASGWGPASPTREEEALVHADTSMALYKMTRQAGVAGSTPIGPQGA